MLELARVTQAHAGGHAVDIEILRDGRRVAGVQCMSPLAASDFGMSGTYSPEVEGFGQDNNWERDIFAVVGFMADHPIVLGFLFPQVGQMLFEEGGRMVYRHPSDVYITIDKDGNTELAHPSGAYMRFGQSPQHEDLTGKDFDKRWKIRRNTDKKVHIHLEQAGGVAKVNVSPEGQIDVHSAVSINAYAPDVLLKGDKTVTLEAPNLYFKGQVTQTQGSSSWAQTMTVETDVQAGGVSVAGHRHTEQGDGQPTSTPNK